MPLTVFDPGSQFQGEPDFPNEVGFSLKSAFKKAKKTVKKGVQLARKIPGASAYTAQVDLVRDIAKGKPVVAAVKRQVRVIKKDFQASAPIAASVVSVVPGVGSGTAAAISGAAAIAQGKSWDQVAIDAAAGAVPGGPLAAAALKAGMRVARGQNVLRAVTSEGMSYAEQNIPGGPIGRAALRAGVGIAKGQNVAKTLVREGVEAAESYVPGGALGRGALRAAGSIVQGQNVKQAVLREGMSTAQQYVPGGKIGRSAVRVLGNVAQGRSAVRSIGREALPQLTQYLPPGVARTASNARPVAARAGQIIQLARSF
jgi:hypothetical protein